MLPDGDIFARPECPQFVSLIEQLVVKVGNESDQHLSRLCRKTLSDMHAF